ncbi:3-dehydroquinate dehydratase, type I [Verruconis gallopava]|uniref:3-dehydroquinate dehydratase, type I n=1 Tax=Verruconis gallopava TaxID=253628 RepID=A0A0D1YXC9_9PEZI|nr:3-dehydroquinate dehydratase, type I [Verruconis gallopava]KIW05362.1 3-dehydroquinate dehydratase, type I [Verruconis gallopava]
MAAVLQVETPRTPALAPAPHALTKKRSALEIKEMLNGEKPSLLVIFEDGQENILREVADCLGQDWMVAKSKVEAEKEDAQMVVGVCSNGAAKEWQTKDKSRILIYFHCVDSGTPIDEHLSELCDYEYLYTQSPFQRRDLARYLSFILGQNDIHSSLSKKARTFMISTTFPDVHQGLPNLDIISVGADAIELRVDLLKEPLPDGSFAAVPSVKYVGEQVMILRQRTELPIIYTTRCTKENGRFPMEDPELFYKYLLKAIKWGCEYIDVEVWLPEEIRLRLSAQKGSSRIISAFHDFTRTIKWSSPEVYELFKKGASFGDIVKMIILVDSVEENYQLEYFRSRIMAQPSQPPFSGLNMGPVGQLSRTLNKVFTPITHPLLPMIAAPGQLSAAEINTALHSMGQMPKKDFYGIGSLRSTGQAMFIEKCFNELSLPHSFVFVERGNRASLEMILKRPNFGGVYLNPPIATTEPCLSVLSEPARHIGQVDTILVREDGTYVGDNAAWKGIRATLSRDFVPSAYSRRAALILANAESDASAAIFALKSLGIGPIYTIGFTSVGPMASSLSPVRSIEDLKQLEVPFAILSALPAEKSFLVGPLLKHYSSSGRQPGYTAGKVFVDLANGPKRGDPLAVAASLGWTAYGIADVSAWTTVETLRLLVGQNVPYDFVRLASGRVLY